MEDVRNTPEFKEYEYSLVMCPVCGHLTLDNYYVCDTCGWEYDGSKGNEYSSANGTSAEAYRKRMEKSE